MEWNGRKLHLGCGAHILPAANGWINLDGKPGPGVDVVLDIHTQCDRLPSGSLTWIYSSHVVEHLCTDVFPVVLGHLRRALRAGGKLTIATTSLEGIYNHRFLRPDNGSAWEAALFGRATSTSHPMDMHRDCFTFAKLDRLLKAAGFPTVRPWKLSEYPELYALNDFGRSCELVTVFAEGIA